MKIVRIAIAVYIGWLLLSYTFAVFDTPYWDRAYYLWDKLKDFILFLGVYTLVKQGYKRLILPVVIFSFIRFVWEIISMTAHISPNGQEGVMVLFTILIVIITYLFIKETS